MKLLRLLFFLCVAAGGAFAQSPVQSITNCSFGGTNNTTITVGGNPSACPVGTGWANNLTAANRVVLWFYRKPGSGLLQSITGDGTCVVKNPSGTRGTDYTITSGAGMLEYSGYCYNLTGGAKTNFTATFSNNEDTWYVRATEYSGTTTGDGFDGSVYKALGSVSAATNSASTGNWTTSTDGDLLDCSFIDDANNGRTATAGTTSLTYTALFTNDNTHTETLFGEYGVQTTHSTSTVGAFTTAGGIATPLIGCMAFRATGATAPNPAISNSKGSSFKTVIQ